MFSLRVRNSIAEYESSIVTPRMLAELVSLRDFGGMIGGGMGGGSIGSDLSKSSKSSSLLKLTFRSELMVMSYKHVSEQTCFLFFN